MVQWKDKAAFHNENAVIFEHKVNGDKAIYLDKNVSFYTYYHINAQRSTFNTGLQTVNSHIGIDSPLRYNKVINFPIFGIDAASLNLEETDHGYDTTYQGNGTIAPFTLAPVPNDFFIAEYLEKRIIFRVISVNYQSVVSNEYYEIEFEFYSCLDKDLISLENQTIHTYQCIFDNIGTEDKSLVRLEDFETIEKIQKIRFTLRAAYLKKFRDDNYNALMFLVTGDRYLYDPMINHFCNKEKVFEIDQRKTPDCFLLYEEMRPAHQGAYEESIYDRITHRDLSDLDQVEIFYDDLEPAIGTCSQFDFLHDRRVRYMNFYADTRSVFAQITKSYIRKEFIDALRLRNLGGELDELEAFIYHYMTKQDILQLCNYLSLVENIRRVGYNLHNFVMIPMVLYVLRQLYNEIICDTSVIDDHMMLDNMIRELKHNDGTK